MSERHPTTRAAKACMEWIDTCKILGWPKSTIPRLVDLWWEYHDDDGKLIESTAPGKQTSETEVMFQGVDLPRERLESGQEQASLDAAFEKFLSERRDHREGLTARQQLWTAFDAGARWALEEMNRHIGRDIR